MKAFEIVCGLMKAWEKNQPDAFYDLVEKNALIYHPYFQKPINVEAAMEVLNTAVSGTSELERYELVKGEGDGINDQIKLFICDSGSRVPDICYVGIMPMLFTIKNEKITEITLEKGYFKKIRNWEKVKERTASDLPFAECLALDSTLAIAIKLAKYWGSNYGAEFLDLFNEDAAIRHIMYSEETTPEVVVDVMNSNVLGTTELYSFALQSGSGKGIKDTAVLRFIETGDQIGYVPEQQGVMKIFMKVKNHKITYLDVQGYEIVRIQKEELA
ncbi:hypothetical protein [[Clostridium] polysaccharolyticum]|uniref:Uncharacterized protein n=1 Tax=[Clostridium] polysaccharolyticum TaxID=29364 RepID=A0A1H9Z9I8_9FIRM|nr:hypothetical protein [[Clostridium] polysaccharolyticum]SES78182.1 hypothetical protein SAMN04487772_10374 [[Clostridium] polysaccharolyticum]